MDINKIRALAKLKNKRKGKVNKKWMFDILNFDIIKDNDKYEKLSEFFKNTKYLPKLINEDDEFFYFEEIPLSNITLLDNYTIFFDSFVFWNNNNEFRDYFPDYRLAADFNIKSFGFDKIDFKQLDFEELIIRHKSKYLFNTFEYKEQ